MQNTKLNDIAFKALDHGVDSVKASGGPLVPFVLTESKINRFVAESLEEGKKKAEEFLSTQSGEPVVALAYDGYLTLTGQKYDAIFVRAFAKEEELGIVLAQRYQPAKFLRKFQTIGNPALVERPRNPLHNQGT
ncbi:MAG TPA: hypothetical protein VGF20_15900 [Candidatus Acidoferrum sp.]|jgi:hypothetical protein